MKLAFLRKYAHPLTLLSHFSSIIIPLVVPNRQDEEADNVKYLKEAGKVLVVVTFTIETISRLLLTA